ncbi:MAG TPA: hypothetical protein VHA78_03495 [Candidatus Peribacteraceae bacterium]|nr:hypothetical protein [Candidatus Peribacteraceae bacterium]
MQPSQGVSPSSSVPRNIDDTLAALKDAIWSRRPILGDIMRKHGDQNILDYAMDFLDVNPSPLLDARKEELISVIEELLMQRLGKDVARGAADQLRKLALVSTIDHHGPVQHPFFVNANIITALPAVERNLDLPYLIVLSFASVSLNNADAYARGITFHGGMNGTGNLLKLPIMPDKLKMGVVYATRAMTREDLVRAEEELTKKEQKNEIAHGRGEKLRAIMEEHFGNDDVLNAPDLNAQITKITHSIWPRFFHRAHQTSGRPVPGLIYLDIETIVTEMLLRLHLTDASSLMYKILFDPAYRALVVEHFDGIPGAFSIEKQWGTYMFWGLDDRQHRLRLSLSADNALCTHDHSICIPLQPEAIAQALRDKKIYPSMMLCYLMVSFYYGMKCLGGFSQVHDLTLMKGAWSKVLESQGLKDEVEALVPVQTRELGGDGMALSYLPTPHHDMVPATGFDMMLEEEDTSLEHFLMLSRKVTLQEIMNPMLPDIYKVLYPNDERDQTLATVHPEWIFKETGLSEKLL